MPLQQTSGAASYDAFGGGAPIAAKYIEDFFQTWLRTGTGSSTTVTTGLNGAINETMVWTKSRSAATNHKLTDNVRGATKALSSNTTGAEVTDSQGLTAFSSTGYTIGTNTDYNNSGATYVDWQWVATPKFFDVVTYTGNGVAGRAIPHNLGSVPGTIIVKSTDNAVGWAVYHRSLGATKYLTLNLTDAEATNPNYWNDTEPTSTNFTVAGTFPTNRSGYTYVAYLFAHNAGGFGLTGTDNVISCGSFTADGSGNATINLGYEPQWVMVKRTDSTSNWFMVDSMRGNPTLITSVSNEQILRANTSDAETSSWGFANPTATGFQAASIGASSTWIYIAIRRGPMRTPTIGTSVFAPVAYAGDNLDNRLVNTGVLTDMAMARARSRTSAGGFYTADRLRGDEFLRTAGSDAALTDSDTFMTPTIGVGNSFSAMNGFGVGNDATYRVNTESDQFTYALRRAPGFFDEVCYTGTGVARTVAHNLGVAPELMIVKSRSSGTLDWLVYSAPTGNANALLLNTTDASFGSSAWGSTTPTASVFSTGATSGTNNSGATFVAYLFASCPGVSKVGSYTGTGTTLQIDCGFTGGARFVLIKRTDSTGDWYVWDSARGIVAGNDPYLLLNSTAAEVTNTDYVDTYAAGFEISSTAPAAINANGGTFIFLAIA